MIGLLDVNVLVALVDRDHMHHEIAKTWLEQDGEQSGWATCLITELGAIRICALLPSAQCPPREAAKRVSVLSREHTHFHWWPDSKSPATVPEACAAVTANQVTDRYLLGFARRHGARLVTFDRGITRVGGDDVICLSPHADKAAHYVGGYRGHSLLALAG